VLRTSGDPLALSSSVRGAIHELDRNQPVVKIRSMEQNVATNIAAPRFRTLLLAIFAAIALVLAAVGIYGVMAYSVAQRTREIGIRMALGSPSTGVFRLILGNGLKVTIAGIVIGLAAAAALTRYLATMLYAVRPTDPLTLLGTALLLIAVAMLACYLPARRATRVDPMLALRHE
jgi:putative ABC transport system permease protein